MGWEENKERVENLFESLFLFLFLFFMNVLSLLIERERERERERYVMEKDCEIKKGRIKGR